MGVTVGGGCIASGRRALPESRWDGVGYAVETNITSLKKCGLALIDFRFSSQ